MVTLTDLKMVSYNDEFTPTRKSLISRLKNWDDHESWSAFFLVYWRLIYSTAIKSGMTEAEAEDVVQETVISVSKAIPSFKYDREQGSFKGWLLQITSCRIVDQWRKRMPARSIDVHRGEDVDSLAEIAAPVMPELERLWEQEWDGNLVRAAVERVKRRIDPKQFQVFELSAIQRWPHEKIKAVLNVSSAAIYVLKHRVSSAIRKELKQLQKKLC